MDTEIEFTDALKRLCTNVWKARKSKIHGWIKQDDNWVTVEPVRDDDFDYLLLTLCPKRDAFGYPMNAVSEPILIGRGDIQEFLMKRI